MKYTLLQLTQEVLSSIDGDAVNTIFETPESAQVVRLIRQTYYDLIERLNPPELYTPFTLTTAGLTSEPVFMSIPDSINKVEWIKYNKAKPGQPPAFSFIPLIPFDEFMSRMHTLNQTDSAVGSVTKSINGYNILFMWRKNCPPEYYSTWDDRNLVFSSYDQDTETYLQSSKTQCYGRRVVTFTENDGYIPELDEQHFSLLLNEAKSLAWAELRQVANAKAEQLSQRGWSRAAREKFSTDFRSYADLPNYGRK